MKTVRPLLLFLGLVAASTACADVKMPAIFGDHMVVQQEVKLPVWGVAEPGETIAVTLGARTAKTVAGADGRWKVMLEPIPAGPEPLVMTVAGKNTLKFGDVLAGEVWLCSGQSNMEFPLHLAHNAAEAEPAAADPQLRFFQVKKTSALTPQTDLEGKWLVCTPSTAPSFSAVAFFFARELRRTLDRPMGLIGSYWGGTAAQAWTSLSGLKQEPVLAHYVAEQEKVAGHYEQAQADLPRLKAAYEQDLKKWQAEVEPAFAPKQKEWADILKKTRAAGQPDPPLPVPSSPLPVAPAAPDGSARTPANLFNAMIAPLMPFAIKGVIWYQGEANGGAGVEYRKLLPRLITDWREKWGQGDFPFLIVQLANFRAKAVTPSEGKWPELREAQSMTLSLPQTGLAVTIDLGMANNIHPMDKMHVGQRLALAAKHLAYGQDVVFSGPAYHSMKVEDGKVRLSFANLGGGLVIGAAPWVPPGATALPTDELKGFAITGADQKWEWAKAMIDGDSVVVSSDRVPAPVAVRYGWADNPDCNLYNRAGLPASPFRTDGPGTPAVP